MRPAARAAAGAAAAAAEARLTRLAAAELTGVALIGVGGAVAAAARLGPVRRRHLDSFESVDCCDNDSFDTEVNVSPTLPHTRTHARTHARTHTHSASHHTVTAISVYVNLCTA